MLNLYCHWTNEQERTHQMGHSLFALSDYARRTIYRLLGLPNEKTRCCFPLKTCATSCGRLPNNARAPLPSSTSTFPLRMHFSIE